MKRFWGNTIFQGMAAIAMYTLFALIPDTFVNWFYDYFHFVPWWGVVICVALACFVAFLPKVSSVQARFAVLIAVAISLPICFYCFRTTVHCFGGDMNPGVIPESLSISLSSFIPPMPFKGRLDTYGYGPFFKLALSHGWLDGFGGMTTMVGYGLYDIIVGVIFVVLSVLLFRKTPVLCLVVLTSPFVFNFFGNVDCYPVPICAAMIFLAFTKKVFHQERPTLMTAISYVGYWLFCGWVHPIAGVVGFLPAVMCVRWLNLKIRKFHIPEVFAVYAFCVLFFAVNIIGYDKPIFTAQYADVPPVFSVETIIHTLNIVVLPVLPLAFFVLRGPASRSEKSVCLNVWISQVLCFTATHFTQGANDQFPYSLYMIGVLIPWLSLAMRRPLEYRAGMVLIALNVLLLIPMVWVHSSDLTIERALYLYPMDKCKHNKEMSWQTHLGLVLGDNLIDNEALKKATLRVFENGARRAEPAGFRGGNMLYHTAFLYHFGEFDRGRQQLSELIRQNPSVVRYFLSVRPGFAYMNRQRFWDDLYALSPDGEVKKQLKVVLDRLRTQAAKERYCLKNPSFARCSY